MMPLILPGHVASHRRAYGFRVKQIHRRFIHYNSRDAGTLSGAHHRSKISRILHALKN